LKNGAPAIGRAVIWSTIRTWAGVSAGSASRIRATTPAVSGEAIEVPESVW